MTDLNPTFEVGKTGIKLTLTAICHDAGNRAVVMGRDYIAAYYTTMKKLCPDHPALADYDAV